VAPPRWSAGLRPSLIVGVGDRIRPLSTLLYYLNRVGLAPRRRRLFFFESGVEPPACTASGVTLAVLDRTTLDQLDYCGGWLTRAEALAKIETPGCWMVGAHSGGRLLGYLWGERGEAALTFFDLRIPLPADVVYRANAFVAPEARGQGLYKSLYGRLAAEARLHGITRTIGCADPANTPVLKQQIQLGFHHYRSAGYLRLGPWRRYRIETPSGDPVLITGSAAAAARALLA
jgi:GNAT superfamily N-acetyltransferase